MLVSNVPQTSSLPSFPACLNTNYRTDLARFFQPAITVVGCEEFQALEEVSHRILVVEADGPLARLLAKGLQTREAAVDIASSIEEATGRIEAIDYKVVILSLDMTNTASTGLLQEFRSKCPNSGVLVLTQRGSVQESVATLDYGADDYLPKPFSLLELTARVRALQRRTRVQTPVAIRNPELVLNRTEFRVERSGRTIDLTPREFALLAYLVDNPGKVLSRSTLMHEVWNMPEEANTNIVDVYMKYLRDKLDAAGEESLIRTVRGVGYVLNRVN